MMYILKKVIIGSFCLVAAFSCLAKKADAYSAYGSRGAEVRQIQACLTDYGLYDGECDGIYGEQTALGVKKYQKAFSLVPDGIAGSKTLSSMKIISEEDINLLAMVINGEARGESFEGQVAVGAVVLNRVEHPSFPDTLRKVVYEKGAFTAVTDGQINKKVTDSSKRAAREALSGIDPTGGAVFYYNPETATCKWIKTRKIIKKIGNHVFCT